MFFIDDSTDSSGQFDSVWVGAADPLGCSILNVLDTALVIAVYHYVLWQNTTVRYVHIVATCSYLVLSNVVFYRLSESPA